MKESPRNFSVNNGHGLNTIFSAIWLSHLLCLGFQLGFKGKACRGRSFHLHSPSHFLVEYRLGQPSLHHDFPWVVWQYFLEYNSQQMLPELLSREEDRTAAFWARQNLKKEVDRSSHVLPRMGGTVVEGEEAEGTWAVGHLLSDIQTLPLMGWETPRSTCPWG